MISIKRPIGSIIIFISAFLLYFAWAGFVKSELAVTTHKGYVVKKYQTTDIAESGINVMSQQVYHIKLSSGTLLSVSAFVYDSLKTGQSAVFAEKQNHVYLIAENKLIY
ncbi:MAG: hypothetical protein ACQEWW_20345 [Bacillota bacterium]